MAVSVRAKRVTDPLDEKVKAYDSAAPPPEDPSDSDPDLSFLEPTDMIDDLLNPKAIDGGDSFHLLLLSHVSCLQSIGGLFVFEIE
ncbi:hypothetical protein HHK36_013128 [Tetracentron sinense]|uniref:Uncharacterized protein n=1 Tax=Tetracentron sinense TaxID=13715 RepID=A0A834ZA82_TETSI|nr:hypothetical protein HHK36_013128 [Tetracentron sinense]